MFLADYDFTYELTNASSAYWTNDSAHFDNGSAHSQPDSAPVANWWALSALSLVVATAAGNILVCLAICWERRLQNVTNYFLMSLAVTDLMVAILVMPLGIYTLFRGKCSICKLSVTHCTKLEA
ncbi:unnamed protein product [Callosobruchus maculatus]|uniref:G-protein coupled receptors family 1 profile domain-containing protein n=1 Tax=Callosobruchus maculatus TaxID=64391 RepID=A0A653CHL4_CALMS|nr:unnamed protein product [Callosobruchus maculatus]